MSFIIAAIESQMTLGGRGVFFDGVDIDSECLKKTDQYDASNIHIDPQNSD